MSQAERGGPWPVAVGRSQRPCAERSHLPCAERDRRPCPVAGPESPAPNEAISRAERSQFPRRTKPLVVWRICVVCALRAGRSRRTKPIAPNEAMPAKRSREPGTESLPDRGVAWGARGRAERSPRAGTNRAGSSLRSTPGTQLRRTKPARRTKPIAPNEASGGLGELGRRQASRVASPRGCVGTRGFAPNEANRAERTHWQAGQRAERTQPSSSRAERTHGLVGGATRRTNPIAPNEGS
jgi:hypothetical protein